MFGNNFSLKKLLKYNLMKLKSQKILGIDVTTSTLEDILEEIRKYLKKVQNSKFKVQNENVKPLIIYTPNPEIITYAMKNEDFKRIVNTAQVNIPDGAGVAWALKKLYGIKVPKISGVDFMLDLVKLAEKESLRIGLIGGRSGVAVKTAECLMTSQPRLRVEVFGAPELEVRITKHESGIKDNIFLNSKFLIHNSDESELLNIEEYFQNLVKKLNEKKIDILFVAFGYPKQEYFINILNSYFLLHNSKPVVLMAVGGSFDYISGKISRAPEWMRNMGLEWLFRLLREPWRLGRQLKGAEFFWKVMF